MLLYKIIELNTTFKNSSSHLDNGDRHDIYNTILFQNLVSVLNNDTILISDYYIL